MSMRKWFSIAGFMAVVGGCSDAGSPTSPGGWLDLRLSARPEGVAGILFTVSGGVIDSVQAGDFDGFAVRVEPTVWRVITIGNLTDGSVGRIWVPDVSRRDSYVFSVEQVAARTTFAQVDASGYSIEVQ